MKLIIPLSASKKAHIVMHHSIDLVLLQFLLTCQWSNPTAWLFYGEFQAVHEYEADEAVIHKGINIKDYHILIN